MSDDEIKTIQTIKKEKKEKIKRELSPQSKEKRRANMFKALEQRRKIYENKKKTDLLNNNIQDLLNNHNIEDSEEKPKPIVKEKIIKQDITPEKKIIKNDNIYNELIMKLENINKKVDKMYYLKKNKPLKQQTPIIIDNNAALSKQNNLLEMIKNKMLIN